MLIKEIIQLIDSDTRTYWEGTKDNKLFIQYCSHCENYQFYPRIICKNCMMDVEWVEASGKGTIYSYTILERAYNKLFTGKEPYVVGLIELEEGPRMMSNIVNVDIDEVEIGMEVSAVYNQEFDEYKLIQFEPVN